MIHYADNPSCSAMRDDPQCSVISTSPGMFRNWQRACPSSYCAECASDARTDSDRYAELRKLVEAWQSHTTGSSQTLADWRHR